LASIMPSTRRFTVFTNSSPIASTVATHSNCDVHLLGGRLRPTTQATVGNVDAIARLRVDVAFMGTNGISPTHGLSTPDADEVATKAAMVSVDHALHKAIHRLYELIPNRQHGGYPQQL
ncbi:hypothetical protein WA841_33640, partial [Pseudomonas aeruginosa]